MTTRSTTKPTLRQILAGLLEQARARPTVSVSFNLSHGLGLHLKIDTSGHLHLGISRFQSSPSLLEWNTVCDAARLPRLPARESEKDERYYLWAEFELPEQEKLL